MCVCVGGGGGVGEIYTCVCVQEGGNLSILLRNDQSYGKQTVLVSLAMLTNTLLP